LAKNFATSFVIEEDAFRASFTVLLDNAEAYFAVAESGEAIIGYVLAFSHYTFYG
jgi:hypothetical protein